LGALMGEVLNGGGRVCRDPYNALVGSNCHEQGAVGLVLNLQVQAAAGAAAQKGDRNERVRQGPPGGERRTATSRGGTVTLCADSNGNEQGTKRKRDGDCGEVNLPSSALVLSGGSRA
jgi:hypothetical protein